MCIMFGSSAYDVVKNVSPSRRNVRSKVVNTLR
ncbi:Uncharacterised protein [Mycobacterium tuberculosis]|nr:Uncharacterised protein [Mycobacterium tuberculosis]